MKSEVKRNMRIMDLYKKALTGKYTRTQLYNLAIGMGVSKPTAQSYIEVVKQRLQKRGLIK